ncbi:SIMPL domain-containing protein [Rhodobacter calidifons]|uniref:SIMPL domain-containing protein n=1 Tax=Rhodobacter calidifons TaxID=2715277 RepID=A0ABX0G8B2_9RHOB|nr:SIMPL domain-containing protein [Rhodobacter calidifons]NHB77525.1 SIMPL domain-containing protein [Rhodobacter calidifons]
MRALNALFLSAALVLPLADPVLADDRPTRTISVTGTGTVEAAPDMATLMIGVTTQGDTAAAALAANTAATDAVIARLTASGIEARDMQTSNLSINPNWTGYDSSAPRISGYVASNMLTVRVRKLDTTGAVLDAAVADGANTLNGLTFGLADPEPAYAEARKEAVADARAKAELLAGAAGVSLGAVLSIADGGAMTDPAPMYREAVSAAPVPVVGGELGLVATVTLTFAIAD